MQFTAKFLVLTSAMLLIFQACTKNQQPTSTQPLTSSQGTGDSGGGNSFAGKPLESYIVEPYKLDSYQQKIAPIINTIAFTDPVLFNIFNYLLTSKAWYLIPSPLESLPDNEIGTMVPTDQTARQSMDAVWINSDAFSKMDAQGQADLVLHELLMGLKLLRFESPLVQCRAAKPLVFCDNKSPLRIGSPKQLNAQDYEDIRSTVASLKVKINYSVYESIEDLFATKGFSFSEKFFHVWGPTKPIELSDVTAWILATLAEGQGLPHYGFDLNQITLNTTNSINSDQTCDIKFRPDANFLDLNITYKNSLIDLQKNYEVRHNYAYGNNLNQKIIRLDDKTRNSQPHQIGDLSYDIDLLFENQRLQSIEVTQLKCNHLKDNKCNEWFNENNLAHFICSIKK